MKHVTISSSPKKLGAVLFVLACACPSVYAGEVEGASDTGMQRAATDENRRNQTRRLDAMARDCERKFAVTRCLDQVQAERLALEGKYHREEAALNDAQRLERGREKKERIAEKAAAHARKIGNVDGKLPLQVNQPKLVPQPTSPVRQSTAAVAKDNPPSAQERSARAVDFQRKQAGAVAKRADAAKRLKEAGAKVRPLPRPE